MAAIDKQDDEDTKPSGHVLCIGVGCPPELANAWAACAERASVLFRMVDEDQAIELIADLSPAAIVLTAEVFHRDADRYSRLAIKLVAPIIQVQLEPFDAQQLEVELARVKRIRRRSSNPASARD